MFVFILFFALNAQALIQIDLQKNLAGLVDQAAFLHEAFKKTSPQLIKNEIEKMQYQINSIQSKLPQMKEFQKRQHLTHLLNSLKDQLKIQQTAPEYLKRSSKKHKQALFRNFIELERVYQLKNLTKSYVFYCSLDKSYWVQFSKKAYNPMGKKSCGQLVW